MALPDQNHISKYTLDVMYFNRARVLKTADIVASLKTAMALTVKDTHNNKPTRKRIDSSRVNVALRELTENGCLERVQRGSYRISDKGLKVYDANPSPLGLSDAIDQAALHVHFDSERTRVRDYVLAMLRDSTTDQSKDDIEAELAVKLRAAIMAVPGKKGNELFEKIACDVVQALTKTTCKPTRYQHDGGIDGIGESNGKKVLYIQAKRFNNQIPGAPVRALAGCCSKDKIDTGYFVTTALFSKDAVAFVGKSGAPEIVAIDGVDLAKLMIKHNLGVSKSGAIDEAYFAG